MSKLLGFYVVRSKWGQCNKPIWVGKRERERKNHKQWILDNVSVPEYDGVTTFMDTESDIIVDDVGYYQLRNGKYLRIWTFGNNRGVSASGYIQRRNKSGAFKDHLIWHGYVNGEHIGNLFWHITKKGV